MQHLPIQIPKFNKPSLLNLHILQRSWDHFYYQHIDLISDLDSDLPFLEEPSSITRRPRSGGPLPSPLPMAPFPMAPPPMAPFLMSPLPMAPRAMPPPPPRASPLAQSSNFSGHPGYLVQLQNPQNGASPAYILDMRPYVPSPMPYPYPSNGAPVLQARPAGGYHRYRAVLDAAPTVNAVQLAGETPTVSSNLIILVVFVRILLSNGIILCTRKLRNFCKVRPKLIFKLVKSFGRVSNCFFWNNLSRYGL